MSAAVTWTGRRLPVEVNAGELQPAAGRDCAVKVLCALSSAIALWFAVPYTFPLRLDSDPLKAAAKAAAAYQGSLSRQIALPLLLLICCYALYRLPKQGVVAGMSRLGGVALCYAAWAAVSLWWSADPRVTGKRLVVFAVDALFAFTLARVASAREMAIFGFLATGMVAVIALVADVYVLHAFAPANPNYRFMGVMTANYQAINLFVCLVCGLTLAQGSPKRLRQLSVALLPGAALLFLTRARVGTFLFLAALLFIGVRLAKRWLSAHQRAMIVLAGLTLMLPICGFAIGKSGTSVFTTIFMMGRNDSENTASLSNRAPLWGELLESVESHPVLGFGYDAFWTAERVKQISFDQGWVVPHAHNTYLDEVLSLGAVGCALYVAMIVGSVIKAWRRYKEQPDELTLLPALLLSWLALLSMTESIPLAPNLPTLLAYACVAKMCWPESVAEVKQRPALQSLGGWKGAVWAIAQGAHSDVATEVDR